MKFLAKRLLHSLFLLVGVSLVCFLFAGLAPGDFYSELQLDSRASPQTIENLRARAGIDRPWIYRYAGWAAGAWKGDFGYSLAYDAPVGPLVLERVRATLLLTGTATLFTWLLAVPWGVWLAGRRGQWPDQASRIVLALLLAVPDLLIAIVLMVWAAETGNLPVGGMVSRDFSSMSALARWRDLAHHMIAPVSVLLVSMTPVLVRHVRTAVGEALDSPFALSGRAMGIPRQRLLFRHLLPAALNPLISLFGVSIGIMLSATPLVEMVMGWPGIGPLFVDAIMARDFAIVLAVVIMSSLCLTLGSLVADLILYRTDPRVRVGP